MSFTTFASEVSEIEIPELEYAAAIDELRRIQGQLDFSQHLVREDLGLVSFVADNAFDKGMEGFRYGHYYSAIRQLETFLREAQNPAPEKYLAAKLKLAQAYSEVRLYRKSARTYLDYVVTFAGSRVRDFSELLEALAAVTEIAHKHSEMSPTQMQVLLSSFSSLTLPKEVREKALLLLAKSAIRLNKQEIAIQWLVEVENNSQNRLLLAKTWYLRGLLALKGKDLARANEYFVKASTDQSAEALQIYSLAQVALARISVAKGDLNAAEKYYKNVPSNSTSYPDALYESIFLYIKMQKPSQAYENIKLYAKNFPHAHQNPELSRIRAALDVRSGQFESALSTISAVENRIRTKINWLDKNFARDNIHFIDLEEAVSQFHGLVDQPETYQYLKRLAEKQSALREYLRNIEGELQDIIFTLGRSRFDLVAPRLVNNSVSLEKTAHSVLMGARRILVAEKKLYSSTLSDIDQQILSASAERRSRMLSNVAQMSRTKDQLTYYADYLDLQRRLGASYQRAQKLNASWSGIGFTFSSEQHSDAVAGELLMRSKRHLDRLLQQIRRLIVLSRKTYIRGLSNLSPHHNMLRFIRQYSDAMYRESLIIEKQRDRIANPHEISLAEQGREYWRLWSETMAQLYYQVHEVGLKAENELESLVDTLTAIESEIIRHRQTLAELEAQFNTHVRQVAGSIISQYRNNLNELLAQHGKWKGDLGWLAYAQSSSEQKQKMVDFRLRQQSLRDQLENIEQGGLWQWQAH